MKKEIIQKLHTSFKDVAYEQDEVEFWLARDLQVLLGYDEWRNFVKIIEKAQEACENASIAAEDQFVEVNKLITHGKGGQRSIPCRCWRPRQQQATERNARLEKTNELI